MFQLLFAEQTLPFYLLILLKHFDARKNKYYIRIGIFIIMNVFLHNE